MSEPSKEVPPDARPPSWPADVPAFEALQCSARLMIPAAYRAGAGVRAALACGTLAGRGDALDQSPTPDATAGRHRATQTIAPLAPAAGRIIGAGVAHLLNDQFVPAIELEPGAAQLDLDHETHDAVAARENRDLLEALNNADASHRVAWIERLRQNGIWADRPQSPDLLGQLEGEQRIDTVICNLLDDEPTVRLNSVLAARSGPMLLAGLGLLARLTGARRVLLALEAGAPARWWSALRKLVRKPAGPFAFELAPLLNDYPQSDPTLLIYAMLSRRLRPGRLPVEQGVLMLDGAAAVAIGRCAVRQQPMLRTPLGIRDHVRQKSHYLIAPIGTPLSEVMRQIDAPPDGVRIYRGEILHQNQATPQCIVGGGELLLHITPPIEAPPADPCIRCAWCVEGCPTRIQPAGLLEAAQREDLRLARRSGLDSCIECGVCTYVCPSHLPLLEGIRKLKAMARQRA